jgi:hypothetical protein
MGQATMIWFYQRGTQHLYYEVRLRPDGPGYELSLSTTDGRLLTEQFPTEESLTRRFHDLQAALTREGWGPLERKPLQATLRAVSQRQGARLSFC